MQEERVYQESLLASLPVQGAESLLPQIRDQLERTPGKIVVVDDDPTGNQTAHDVMVLTAWETSLLKEELASARRAFFVLSNSRSKPAREACAENEEIGRRLRRAAEEVGREFVVISRSDSTLRGHFPDEVSALVRGLRREFDAWLIIPSFIEGGRYTVGDVHYVADGTWLVPVGQTEFARDPAFGFRASNLRRWVVEKSAGRIAPAEVSSISIEEIRGGGPEHIAARLKQLHGGAVCIVNAVAQYDLETFTLGLLQAEADGKRFVYRTAASFVQVRSGMAAPPLLAAPDLALAAAGAGLLIAGSHVSKTTRQLQQLLARANLAHFEINTTALVDELQQQGEVRRMAAQIDDVLGGERDVLVYTGRRPVEGKNRDSAQEISRRVSAGVVAIVRALVVRPRYILAKGGITASDIAVQALNVQRAHVLGQLLPGVSVWRLGLESRLPGIPYVVFPGNVGDDSALLRAWQRLQAVESPKLA